MDRRREGTDRCDDSTIGSRPSCALSEFKFQHNFNHVDPSNFNLIFANTNDLYQCKNWMVLLWGCFSLGAQEAICSAQACHLSRCRAWISGEIQPLLRWRAVTGPVFSWWGSMVLFREADVQSPPLSSLIWYVLFLPRFAMLKQWMINPDIGEIHIEQKYRTWVENLRTDRYVTVQPSALLCLWFHTVQNCFCIDGASFYVRYFWPWDTALLYLTYACRMQHPPWDMLNCSGCCILQSGDGLSAGETLREGQRSPRVYHRTLQGCPGSYPLTYIFTYPLTHINIIDARSIIYYIYFVSVIIPPLRAEGCSTPSSSRLQESNHV